MMCNLLADSKNKKGSYSHYSDYSGDTGLQLTAGVRENDLLSFAVSWEDDVHRKKDASHVAYDCCEDRTWSLTSGYQWATADNVDIVAGISYDWRDNVEAKKHEEDGSIIRYDDNSQSVLNWQVMGKYHFANEGTLALSYYDRTRFPTLKEHYTTSEPTYSQIAVANPQPRSKRAYGAGLTWNDAFMHDWGFEVSVYCSRVNDVILSRSIDADTIQNQNNGTVDRSDSNVGIEGKINSMLDVGLSYALAHAGARRESIDKITDLPTQTTTAWMTPKPWRPLGVALLGETRSPSYSNGNGLQKAVGSTVIYIRADYTLGHDFSVNTSVNNLFGTKYAYSEGLTEEGRNFRAGIEHTF